MEDCRSRRPRRSILIREDGHVPPKREDYRRQTKVLWTDSNCTEGNTHIAVGKDDYFVSADGYLMPVRKNQPAPDLRYFKTGK